MSLSRLAAALVLVAATNQAGAQSEISGRWAAQWIDVPGVAPQAYGVYHFRRSFPLAAAPSKFVIHVSGDNRYQLFVNGQRVSLGPARGDLTHWRYETVDIASHLHPGNNLLAAVVWNDGEYKSIAQVSNQTGFLLQADGSENATVNTGKAWLCAVDHAYRPRPLRADQNTGYYALGANEEFDAGVYPWGWEQPGFDDSTWTPAHEIGHASARDARDAPNRWMLVASGIPLEEQVPESVMKVRKTVALPSSGFPQKPVTIPAHTSASVLLDQSYLTTAYPSLQVSGGQHASIDLRYAETMYLHRGDHSGPTEKGNRNDVDGKQFYGSSDRYIADGSLHRVYRPLFWRTFRYLQIDVETADQPLTLESLQSTFTAYPFRRTAVFDVAEKTTDTDVQKILTTGWRTARLCAHETYMDCPYYEQLQYAGDARIQMMVSLYMTGDARLMKNGIALLNSSRTAEGATYSRAPSALQQYIPPFSLWWIGMVHDYWMYVDDPAFVKQMLPGVHAVLSFYAQHQKENGSLRRMPWWNFVDWVKQWPNGEPPAEHDGSSAGALDLQLLLAYGWAADLEQAFGSKALSDEYRSAGRLLQSSIQATDWDPARGLFADQPSHLSYSQQVNTLALLARIVPAGQERAVMEKIIGDRSLAQSSIYFRAYTNAALREAGLGDRYLSMLEPWREMLGQGLTTWAEWNGGDSRSDCHAWGASPNFELLRTVAGIESAAPGFSRVRISPHMGTLHQITAEMPHPKGNIRVKLNSDSDRKTAEIELPPGVFGEFVVNGRTQALSSGRNHTSF